MEAEFFTKASSVLKAVINSLLFRIRPKEFFFKIKFRKVRRFDYVSQSILKEKGVDDAELIFSIFD